MRSFHTKHHSLVNQKKSCRRQDQINNSLSVPPAAILFLCAYCALTEALLTAEGSMALFERADMGMVGLADADGEPKPKRSAEEGVTRPLGTTPEAPAVTKFGMRQRQCRTLEELCQSF